MWLCLLLSFLPLLGDTRRELDDLSGCPGCVPARHKQYNLPMTIGDNHVQHPCHTFGQRRQAACFDVFTDITGNGPRWA
jgi:hypothetical protein